MRAGPENRLSLAYLLPRLTVEARRVGLFLGDKHPAIGQESGINAQYFGANVRRSHHLCCARLAARNLENK